MRRPALLARPYSPFRRDYVPPCPGRHRREGSGAPGAKGTVSGASSRTQIRPCTSTTQAKGNHRAYLLGKLMKGQIRMPFSSPREHTRQVFPGRHTLHPATFAAQAAAAGSLTPATLSALVHAKNGTGCQSRHSSCAATTLWSSFRSQASRRTWFCAPMPASRRAFAIGRFARMATNHAGACAPGKEVAWTIPGGVRCLLQIEAGRTPATLAHATPVSERMHAEHRRIPPAARASSPSSCQRHSLLHLTASAADPGRPSYATRRESRRPAPHSPRARTRS